MSAIPREAREYTPTGLLDRVLDLSRVNLEVIGFVGLVLLSIFTHLWGLSHMAMHHDESVTSWTTWRFYTGAGSFTCAGGRVASTYCYDPVYHGPAYYILTLGSFFLFGDGEAQSRLPEAIAGILMVASSWMLRPYLGKRGALIAGLLLGLTPALLYYARFSRHDGLMLLWTLWIVIGFFRYLDSGQPRYLYLFAASVALAMATHELYYILFFLFGSFLLIRMFSEVLPPRRLQLGMITILAVAVVIMLVNPPISDRLRAGGLALLIAVVFGLGLLMMRVWDDTPVVTARAVVLWQHERRVLWTALGILVTIFVLLYSTFFADPHGIIDGLYQGLAYWLGSQHEYARGDQPWYYYLMLLPLYEPLGFFGSLAAAVYLFTRPRAAHRGAEDEARELKAETDAAAEGTAQDPAVYPMAMSEAEVHGGDATPTESLAAPGREWRADGAAESADPVDTRPHAQAVALFPLFLAFWFIGALVAFSWAGEKMPWLVTHIALPGNLLIAWALGRLIDSVEWRRLPDRRAALIPVALVLLLIALAVALWRMGSPAEGQQGQANFLQGLIPLAIVGVLIYGLLTIAQIVGTRLTLTLCALTIAGLLGAYMIRATWMVVYDHPDTPRELLVYTQTTPDVPLIVEDLRMLAINQTRNVRTPSDPIGGHSMPVIMDSGEAGSGDGSLAWPFQWYLRDFQRIENHDAEFFRKATADSFQVAVDRAQPEGEKEFAPAVMVYVPHMTDATREALKANYVKRYDSKLNWWFPEGNKCDPQAPGYKRFYYNTATLAQAKEDKDCKALNLDERKFEGVLAPLLWPLDRSHWSDTARFLLFRELPAPLRLDGREMQVWVRKDLAPGGAAPEATTGGEVVKLVAQQVIGMPGSQPGQLTQPRGVAVDSQGNVYVADTGNHRVEVFKPDGTLLRSIGGFGSGDGQLNEPRGIAVDAQGNLYVADTWNARIVKFDSNGTFLKSWGEGKQEFGGGRRATVTEGDAERNAAEPLGFFGPRGIAVDKQGNVYIADTGNKRVVVTDSEGKFLYQWGHLGADPGSFSEPIGIGVDGQGNVYVADTWNGRVQVFGRAADGKVNPIPSITWKVSGWQPNTYEDPYLTVSEGGQVFATVPLRDTVIYANMRGDVLLRWGGKGTDLASVTSPSGAAVGPDGSVYITDRANGRVLRFTLPKLADGTAEQP